MRLPRSSTAVAGNDSSTVNKHSAGANKINSVQMRHGFHGGSTGFLYECLGGSCLQADTDRCVLFTNNHNTNRACMWLPPTREWVLYPGSTLLSPIKACRRMRLFGIRDLQAASACMYPENLCWQRQHRLFSSVGPDFIDGGITRCIFTDVRIWVGR